MKSVAILLTVFNRKEKTLQCLQHLIKQLPVDSYETDIYLTDDGCTDGTPEVVREKFPEVNIIRGDGNLYWNRGMHQAWLAASAERNYDFYLWLNDDTNLFPKALSALLEGSSRHDDKAIICGATCSEKKETMTYGGRNAKGELTPPNGELHPCEYFNGNIVLIPRSVFQLIGNLDPAYTHALGDFDYGMRAREAGIEIYQAPNFIGTCEQHDTLPKWCDSGYPLKVRLKHFRSPLGGHPREQFRFEKRHYGSLRACFHYLTIHLRVLIPQLWEKDKL